MFLEYKELAYVNSLLASLIDYLVADSAIVTSPGIFSTRSDDDGLAYSRSSIA